MHKHSLLALLTAILKTLFGTALSRLASLQKQIANFRNQLEECERKNGKS
jgi:hypothetical protein